MGLPLFYNLSNIATEIFLFDNLSNSHKSTNCRNRIMKLSDSFVDVRSLIVLFGGPKALAEKLTEAGVKTSVKAIYKCAERQSITGNRLAQILTLSERPGLKNGDPIAPGNRIDVYAFIRNLKDVPPELLPKEIIPPVIKLKQKNKPVKNK